MGTKDLKRWSEHLEKSREMDVLFEADIPELPLIKRGRSWDIYDLGEKLLMVATDRISIFDVVLPTPIPGKGRVLVEMCRFWFDRLADIMPNHFVSTDISELGQVFDKYSGQLEGRSILAWKADVLPVECIVRGYLAGSGWQEYQEKGSVCGIRLRRGLKLGQRLEKPLFTPAMKKEAGEYKEPITYEEMVGALGADISAEIREKSVAVYNRGREICVKRGLILADVKLVFGLVHGRLSLVDEVLTSDSSRIWPKENFTPGKVQASYDKQFIRDYLDGIGWNRKPAAPKLPDKIIAKTVERYSEALQRMTGESVFD